MSSQPVSRRTMLRGAAFAGAAGAGLVACADPGGEPASPVPTEPVTLGAPDDVPVGGAKLYRQERLVVSRPAEGEYKAFGAVCTHRSCDITELDGTDMRCVCHGSRFDAMTGKALQGPAVAPLPAVPVTVESGKLVAGEV